MPYRHEEKEKKHIKNNNNKTLSGFAWMFSGTGAKGILQFLVLIILARLIAPEEFGVVSAALIVISFTEIMSMLGIGPAIIQRPNLTSRHIYTGYTTVLLLNISFSTIIFISSPILAKFFNMEELNLILKVLCLVFLIKALGTVAEFLAQRELKFKLYSLIQVTSYIIYSITGITLALLSFGVWALVFAHIMQSITTTLLFILNQPHTKRLSIHKESFKELLYFGGGYSLARLANQLALQGDNLVIGKLLGAGQLGLYGRAYQLMAVPAVLFGEVMDRVLFPIMSKIQNSKNQLINTYMMGISLTAFIILPISAFVIVMAEEVIWFLFGEKWVSIAIPVKILSLGMLFRTSYKISDSLVRAKGAVYKRALRQTVYAFCVVIGSFIGHYWGLVGVSIGVLGAVAINFIMMAHLSIRLLETKWAVFLIAHVRPFLLAIGVYIISNITYLSLDHYSLLPFLVIFITALVVFSILFLGIYFFPRFILGKQGLEFLKTIKTQFKR